MSKRIQTVDCLSVLMMIFVIMGHCLFPEAPAWYKDGRTHVYAFHMSVFMCVSGFLVAYSCSKETGLRRECSRSLKKIVKFFSLILGVGGAVVALKLLTSGQLLSADAWFQNVRLLVFYPMLSEAQFLWYIYLLCWVYFLYPIIRRLPDLCLIVVGVAAMLCSFCFWNSWGFMGISQLIRYLPYIFLGVYVCRHLEWFQSISNRRWMVASVPFAIYSLLYSFDSSLVFSEPWMWRFWMICLGVLALPFWLAVSRWILKYRWMDKSIEFLSRYLLYIYVLQMFVLHALYAVIKQVGFIHTMPYALFVLLSTIVVLVLVPLMVIVSQKIYNKIVLALNSKMTA